MTDAELLVGHWLLVSEEPEARLVEFVADGTMHYVIDTDTGQIVLDLTYRLEGDQLVSTQTISGQETRSRYRFEGPSTLVLEQGGETFRYERQELPSAP